METVLSESTEMGVLNESTQRIHKHEPGQPQDESACGATSTVTHDRVRVLPVDVALDREDVTKCGRCFGDAGGY